MLVDELLQRYRAVRAQTIALAVPLAHDDQLAQSMPEASPTKWHLGHTSWFFEKMLLEAFVPSYVPLRADADWVFNSYYESVGERQARGDRSLLTRPTLDEVHAYRRAVDARVLEAAIEKNERALAVLDLGIHHEQQHQELVLTDIKSVLAPQKIAYVRRPARSPNPAISADFVSFDGGLVEIGHGAETFAFDNERPRHKAWLERFALASRLVTQGQWLAFIDAGGYDEPSLWLSDGWASKNRLGWRAPLYWEQSTGGWTTTTMSGEGTIDANAPVCHVSFYEADAFARWSGARLPTESEWEHASSRAPIEGTFLESGEFHPACRDAKPLAQMFGEAWQWTASPYVPYPRFVPFDGAASEYNGKFMCNQMVLRGGSCFTPRSHIRATYRNFFPPEARWQMSAVRLAKWLS
jgi:ergothioneine biosynthesis protein EgtB